MPDICESLSALVPLALKGLRAMAGADGTVCETAWRDPQRGLRPAGRSARYGAMTLVGLAMQRKLGRDGC